MKIDTSQFVVRLAQSQDEVRAAQRLRYRVFVEEMGADASAEARAERLEVDDFDEDFEHLILIDNAAEIADPLDRVAGVYRLLSGSRAKARKGFYGANEYDLRKIEALGRETLELGRSCIAKPYRSGLGMHLLWNGLAEYVLSHGVEVLFGVASFPGTDADKIAPALSYLHHRHLAPTDLRVRARAPHRVEMDRTPAADIDPLEAMRMTPSLIKSYLKLGGFVGDGAYVDHSFNTIDICLLMDTQRMTAKYREWYEKNAR